MIKKLKKIDKTGIALLSVLVLLVVVVLVSTVTHAFWYEGYEQADANTVKTGCFSFTMTEDTASINLNNTYPMTETDAMANVTPYTFTITNSCSMDMYYNVTLNTSGNNDLNSYIAYKLIDESNEVKGPGIVGSLPQYQDYNNYTYTDDHGQYNILTSYVLTTGKLQSAIMNSDNTQVVTAGGSKQYRLYLWVDENTEGTATMNKTFTAKVIVTGTTQATTAMYKCKRATRLHTASCASEENVGCRAIMNENDTITYGSLGTTGLVAGDAFDCDVNNDGRFSSEDERFYYVTNLSGDAQTAVLVSSNTSTGASYDSNGVNTNGPVSLMTSLPTTSSWENVSLKNTTRNILDETGLPVKSDYSYTGYAARPLTYQEVAAACSDVNALSSCAWLLENTKYQDSTKANGYWLETASQTAGKAWNVNTSAVELNDTNATNGVKVAIEVPIANINY